MLEQTRCKTRRERKRRERFVCVAQNLFSYSFLMQSLLQILAVKRSQGCCKLLSLHRCVCKNEHAKYSYFNQSCSRGSTTAQICAFMTEIKDILCISAAPNDTINSHLAPAYQSVMITGTKGRSCRAVHCYVFRRSRQLSSDYFSLLMYSPLRLPLPLISALLLLPLFLLRPLASHSGIADDCQ